MTRLSILLAVAVAAGVLAVASGAPPAYDLNASRIATVFQAFEVKFARRYSTTEERNRRHAIFSANLAKIEAHNTRFAAGLSSYEMGINEFADLTSEEFFGARTMPTGLLGAPSTDNTVYLPKIAANSSVDWREKGAVTKVKNQGQCGSCWAFSTTGSIEGRYEIATGTLVSLSEQELMDCSKAEGNDSCNGGLMEAAFKFVIKNGGLDSEADYKYTARDEKCKKHKEKKYVAKIKSFSKVPRDEEDQLLAAVAEGPVSVSIEADKDSFQFYKRGVYDNAKCGHELDHGVLAVGYGTEGSKDYWIVKNSWGKSWGDEGYIMMARGVGKQGICGIAMDASYPIV
eukprot:m.478291 g.478291  ORF g.478291 m.478291 type:complete len:343 (-) comp21101_c0_seq1:470-1498(-)